ncbi:MAG: radical SAM protein [Deltaproteobacteria bacterium]|nr:radical SAM protein [Deltaproteobacteria bacterium]
MSTRRNSTQEIDPHINLKKLLASDFPDRVTVELTNHCNLNCVMCPRHHMKGTRGYMTWSLFKKIIDEMAEHDHVVLVPFFRGESLLHPHSVEMLAYAKRKNNGPVQFTTNATLLSEDVASALLETGIDFISFSVDSVDPKTYKSVRRRDDLKKVLKNIETFCNLKMRKNMKNPEIQVSVVKTKKTAGEIEGFIKFWKDRVDRIRVYEEHSRNGHFGSLKKGKRLKNRMPCLKPFTDMVIYWDGKIALCNHDWDRTDHIGDVSLNAISEIWHNRRYENIRSAHQGHGVLEELCQYCDHWQAHSFSSTQIGDLYVRESAAL